MEKRNIIKQNDVQVRAVENCLDWGVMLSTGISVEQGQTLTLDVDQSERWFGWVTPNGVGGPYRRGGFAFPWGTLVGTLDNGQSFFKVGFHSEINIQSAGTLLLGCWDTNNRDNSGLLNVTIQLSEPTPDDLSKIEGIGPKINGLLQKAEITTFAELAASSVEQIDKILDAAGRRYATAVPTTWPEQAALAAAEKWDELKTLQDELCGGRRVKPARTLESIKADFGVSNLTLNFDMADLQSQQKTYGGKLDVLDAFERALESLIMDPADADGFNAANQIRDNWDDVPADATAETFQNMIREHMNDQTLKLENEAEPAAVGGNWIFRLREGMGDMHWVIVDRGGELAAYQEIS